MAYDYARLRSDVRLMARDTDSNNYAVTDPQQDQLLSAAIVRYLRAVPRLRASAIKSDATGLESVAQADCPKLSSPANISEFLGVRAAKRAAGAGPSVAYDAPANDANFPPTVRLEPVSKPDMEHLLATYPPAAGDPYGATPKYYAVERQAGSAGKWLFWWWPVSTDASLGAPWSFAFKVMLDYPEDGTLPELDQAAYRTLAALAALDHAKLAGADDTDLADIRATIPEDEQKALGLYSRQVAGAAKSDPTQPPA